MKKKLISLIMAFACAIICAFGLVGCDNGGGACEHNFVQKTYHQPTCTEGSYYDEECSKCGETRKGRELQSASGHGRAQTVYNNDETCTKNGTQSWVCPLCHETISEEVPNSAKHIFNGTRDCERCDAQIENKYLKYELNDAGDGYIVDCNSIEQTADPEYKKANEDMRIVNIPAVHEGLPVVEIKRAVMSSTTVVYISASVKVVAGLNGINLRKIVVEEGSSWEKIGENAFSGSHITELKLPEGITALERYSLANMEYLTCLTLPQSLETMEPYCLDNNGRLNTIINHSDLPLTDTDLNGYFGYPASYSWKTQISTHFAVREENPNYLLPLSCTAKTLNETTNKEFDIVVYFSYIHIDGENILTGIFDDGWTAQNAYKIEKIEIPYGITQVDTSALQYKKTHHLMSVGTLELSNSVSKINKVTNKDSNYTENTYTYLWNKILLSEYTNLSDFEADDFIKYSYGNAVGNIFETYKDENPVHYVEYYFHDLWASIADSDYIFKKNGITITFAEANGASMDGIGEVYQQTEDELAHVYFGDTGLTIFIELDDGAELSVQSLALQGHTTGLNNSSVYLRGMYFDEEVGDYVSGMRETWSFNRTDHMYSYREFDYGDYKNSTKWKFDLWTNKSGNYSYSLRSIKIAFEKLFNADLTEKQ